MIKKNRIAVIGQGFVGGSLTTVMTERGFNVTVYDKAGKVATGGNALAPHVLHGRQPSVDILVDVCESSSDFAGVYFVCLPTPMRKDGSADLRIVEGVLDQLAACSGERVAVVKSTVPPGTTASWNEKYKSSGLRVVFNPEFLTEANALNDMRNQNRIILGGPRPHINVVKRVFSSAFPEVPIVKTNSTTAEMVKYLTNAFLATKVSFANEIYDICQQLDGEGFDIDYDKVIEYATFDPRLGKSHWAVPGPDGSRGWGGHCFPKDMMALITLSSEHGIDPKVLKAAYDKNLEVRPAESRDWEAMKGRAVSDD